MSIILAAPDYETIRLTVLALARQTASQRLELVFAGLGTRPMAVPEKEVDCFFGHRVIEAPGETIASALAAGIRESAAPVVAFTEDHCFPDRGWAEALMDRHREGWAGVGPVMVNANPKTAVSWANFLVKYGDWIEPVSPESPRQIPGHNSSYRKEIILNYGEDLEKLLESETVMQWDLKSRGYRLCLEPKARAYHLNYSRFGPDAANRFHGGRLFAARRSRSWTLSRRLLYAAGSPLLPLVRTARVYRTLSRIKRSDLLPRILAPTLALLSTEALGELSGYLSGAGRAADRFTDSEFHRDRFMVPEERDLAWSLERIFSAT
jgi:hypothetical protein